jgi:hypothetical protein
MPLPSLFVIVPGFGAPHIEEKNRILESNLRVIRSGPWSDVHVCVCCYDDADVDVECVTVIRDSGYVGDFLRRWVTPKDIEGFDYVLALLDDFELVKEGWDWEELIRVKEDLKLDLISPVLTSESPTPYPYMRVVPEQGRVVKMGPACEFFCYFMDRHAWARYHVHLDPCNPWMWGYDTLLQRQFGLRVGRLNWMLGHHYFSGTCYGEHPTHDPYEGWVYTLAKYGEDRDALARMRDTNYMIFPM